jgi:hypothetical protein
VQSGIGASDVAIHLFVDEGAFMFALAPAARAAAPTYVKTLPAAFTPPRIVPSAPLAALPGPLSQQEPRALQQIIAGKSNQEVAAALVSSAD